MNRVIVFLLSALDAVVQAAIGLALAAATVTLALVFAGEADWAALWPATGAIWQLGNLVPQQVSLPDEVLIATGLPEAARAFALNLAPLGFALITAVTGVRSGTRAARAGAPATGIGAAAIVSAAIAAGVAATAHSATLSAPFWLAVLAPAALYTGAVLVGAFIEAWRHGGWRAIDAAHERFEAAPASVQAGLAAGVRGATVAVVGLGGLGGLGLGLAIIVRGADVIALFQGTGVDAAGAVVMTIGQLVYLPTLVVWAAAWISGAGFALGAETAIGPIATQTGVAPAIPVLSAIPPVSGGAWLAVALAVVAVGALAGWIARSGLVASGDDETAARWSALAVTALVPAVAAALLAVVASGSMGPGALAHVGPSPLLFGAAVLGEIAVGAGILLLSPRAAADRSTSSGSAASAEPQSAPR